jgi:hypothetical protein
MLVWIIIFLGPIITGVVDDCWLIWGIYSCVLVQDYLQFLIFDSVKSFVNRKKDSIE